ncbi:hypothetical protein AKJ39_00105 [candidate division MSBL1 archaeon SCGC-AAA259J03]|uniref:Winged helix-turn helix domain-containing protein n=2 Tax=candidate division MSBL1 TaxID=215777 RepID=A0A133UU38_9EURY|nr:hypothetical protein AKJ38_00480 [candidate division MSBL1 archaeon SCGC-AAA259I14]KXA98944.1 hypothetical protein AKJ39_00105 [candidate division MSBL1 archaeon SCGC-AAA259J03]
MSKKEILHRSVDVEWLRDLRKEEDDPKVRDRIMALIMEVEGYERREIARLLGTSRTSVWRWIKRFDESGIEGLWDEERPGRPSKLSELEKESLREDLKSSPKDFGYESEVWSTKMVLDHLREEYGIEYHPRYIQRFLRSLGFELKKPRPKHHKASEEEKENYYQRIEEAKKGRP